MKYRGIAYTILFVTLLGTVASCGRPRGPEDLWGVWKGTEAGQDLTVGFQEDGDFILKFRDQESGAEHRLKGTYEADFTKRPIPISVRSIRELPNKLYMIVKFESDSVLYMSQFSTKWRLRPIAFEADKTVRLSRAGR